MTRSLLNQYEARMRTAREEFAQNRGVQTILSSQAEPRWLHRFLIEWCALGVQVTRPVDGWIRRAGQRCIELGDTEIGSSLVKHADHEAGHDLMFVDDTHALVDSYNETYGEALSAQALLAQDPTPGMRDYIVLHEETIKSEAPYAQVAIELEIEGLSVREVPKMMEQFGRVLGENVLDKLSFLKEHVALDIGHTALNEAMLSRLLNQHPEAMALLVRTGMRALSAYAQFLQDCVDHAAETARPDRVISNRV